MSVCVAFWLAVRLGTLVVHTTTRFTPPILPRCSLTKSKDFSIFLHAQSPPFVFPREIHLPTRVKFVIPRTSSSSKEIFKE